MLRNAQISQNYCAIAGGTSSLNSWSFLFCISKSRWNQIDNFLQTRLNLTIVGDHHFSKFKTCRYWDGPISACLGFTWKQDMQILAQSWFWKLRLIYYENFLYVSFPFNRRKKIFITEQMPHQYLHVLVSGETKTCQRVLNKSGHKSIPPWFAYVFWI